MNDANVKLWQVVLALTSLTLVVVSMIYWLNSSVPGATSEEAAQLKEQVMGYEEEIASLKEENERLQNLPPKEITVEKECPTVESDAMMQTAECPQCPECPKAETATTMNKDVVIQKPMAVSTTVCTKMAIGKWGVPKSCQKEVENFLSKHLDENTDFFVITPIVDTRKYKGKQPELKQAGLGQYRAESVKKLLKERVGPNIHMFQKKTMQKHEMRGFVVELYHIGQAE